MLGTTSAFPSDTDSREQLPKYLFISWYTGHFLKPDQAELEMIDVHGARAALDELAPVTDAEQVRRVIAAVRSVHVAPEVKRYVVDLVAATRQSPELRLGASPRATRRSAARTLAAIAIFGSTDAHRPSFSRAALA